MKVIGNPFGDVLVLQPTVHSDCRGFFYECYSEKESAAAMSNFSIKQVNHSFSAKTNTFRGLHLQKGNASQSFIVSVMIGRILDFVVDVRVGSSTFLKTYSQELSDDNRYQIFVPKGFAHGFLTLTDNVHMLYKMDNLYDPANEVFLNVFDPGLNIDLGVENDQLIMSERERSAPFAGNLDLIF